MLTQVVQYVTGFSEGESKDLVLVGLVLATVLGIGLFFVVAHHVETWVNGRRRGYPDRERPHPGGFSAAPASARVSDETAASCPEYGSKNCELRGCDILGHCSLAGR